MSDILDALSYIGDSLNKPGRAVRGVLAGRPDELAAAIPFSDSMGITDPGNATSGKDLLNALGLDVGNGLGGDVAGFATEVATDPLTWLGAGLGSRLGAGAEKAAVARGPQYETTADDLARMLGGYLESGASEAVPGQAARRIQDITSSPIAGDLLSRIPTNGSLLGAGAEGAAFAAPNNSVVRVGRMAQGDPGRQVAEGLLQPISTTDFGGLPAGARGWRAEVLPRAEGVGEGGMGPLLQRPIDKIDQSLAKSGLAFTDRIPGNYGHVNGVPMVIDPGAVGVIPGKSFAGPYAPVATHGAPSAPMSALLDALGATADIRGGVDPRYQALLGLAGAGGGANLGAFGRAVGGQ